MNPAFRLDYRQDPAYGATSLTLRARKSMPLLHCKGYVKPILSILNKYASGLSGTDLTEQVAANTNLTEEERKEAITDGTPKYVVRIKQTRYWLKNQQFVEALECGTWAITNLGTQFLEQPRRDARQTI